MKLTFPSLEPNSKAFEFLNEIIKPSAHNECYAIFIIRGLESIFYVKEKI